ncbi:hypothetical protein B296_00025408 [Ensete ventricosum]|uniref:Uncharacterized protein n=1 Tax=Ensete ventricosum TaxID=4639 RepID=A0A426ZG21_ENSVE|nr:hypothetical protein B296_00025408 [Ensete ventricosum]
MSVAVVPSASALGDSGIADASVTMQSFFNVDSTVTARWLVEVRKNYFIPPEYKLHVPLLGDHPYDAFSCGFGLSTDAHEAAIRFLLHPVIEACLEQWRISPSQMAPNLWRYLVAFLWECHKATAEQPADTFGSTARTTADKGKEMVKLGEAPERGYTMRELCKVEDRAGADRYFTSIITRLKCIEGEDPLVPRWSTISESSPFLTEGPLSGEYLRGALHPTLAKQVYECSSEELMNRAGKLAVWVRTYARPPFSSPLIFSSITFVCLHGLRSSALIDWVHDAGRLVRSQHEKILALRAVNKELKAGAEIKRMRTELESLRSQRRELEQEVGLLCSSLDKAQNDRARLERDVLLLIEVATLLEAKLKAEGLKAVATYKASR